jgi:carbamoyl-phosphate synthase small subunit
MYLCDQIKKMDAILLLQDGKMFRGKAAGKIGTTSGEICFNTGMTGYQEVFTDPSYFGQLLVTTNVHIGNYGIKQAEAESESIKISGLICRNFNIEYSRSQADSSIQAYLEQEELIAICDIDTRELVRHIRDKGAMNGIISSEITDVEILKAQLAAVPSMAGLELASKVSTTEAYELGDAASAKYRVAVMDFGCKKNIIRNFIERDCFVKVFPAKTTFSEIKSWNPDGYFLSNGPGDPEPMDYAIATVKEILKEDKPTFGICLGHQLLALANDVPTYKMHHGHRGINHPVKNLLTGRCEVTSQNHGFAVNPEVLRQREDIEITHINLNDDTIEGIRLKNKPAFSVQYHPEAAPGPLDARYLFDDFINMMSAQ